MRQITDELAALEEQGLRRNLMVLPSGGGKIRLPHPGDLAVETAKNKTVRPPPTDDPVSETSQNKTCRPLPLNFASNDYLDLASADEVKAASVAAVNRLGCGASASRLMSGHLQAHEDLETALASLTGGESALVFGSGFLANLGVVTALARRGDDIFCDRLNHASLIDGIRLSGAKLERYAHKDVADLEKRLQASRTRGRRLIVTDSIFSMDGDIAPLGELSELARRYEAMLVVDEAHAIGIMGSRGGGVCQELGLEPDLRLGTLSKALGSYGGFAVCSAELRDLLINRARSFIYSTALPPACLAAAQAAIALVQAGKGTLGKELLQKAAFFRNALLERGLAIPSPESQILQLPVGDNRQALALAEELWRQDILATAIRPPTVPVGTARLRLSVTLAHDVEDLTLAAEKIAVAAKSLGLAPTPPPSGSTPS
jgi:8-amino-7-oxononanoate synthase